MAHAQVTPDQPLFNQDETAGAPIPDAPRFGTPYRGYNAAQVTPDHPKFDPKDTAGAAVPAEPRFGKAYRGKIIAEDQKNR